MRALLQTAGRQDRLKSWPCTWHILALDEGSCVIITHNKGHFHLIKIERGQCKFCQRKAPVDTINDSTDFRIQLVVIELILAKFLTWLDNMLVCSNDLDTISFKRVPDRFHSYHIDFPHTWILALYILCKDTGHCVHMTFLCSSVAHSTHFLDTVNWFLLRCVCHEKDLFPLGFKPFNGSKRMSDLFICSPNNPIAIK